MVTTGWILSSYRDPVTQFKATNQGCRRERSKAAWLCVVERPAVRRGKSRSLHFIVSSLREGTTPVEMTGYLKLSHYAASATLRREFRAGAKLRVLQDDIGKN